MQYFLRPTSACLRSQLERCTVRRPVEISGGIEDKASGGIAAILPIETVHHLLCPSSSHIGRQFEDCAKTISTALNVCAVEITSSIGDQASNRLIPILVFAKVVQDLLRPTSACCGRQLERSSVAIFTAFSGRAIEISSCIED